MGKRKMVNCLFYMIFLSVLANSNVQAVSNKESVPKHPSAFKSNKMTFEATIDFAEFISQLKRSIFHQMHLHGSNTSNEVDYYTSQLHDQADKVDVLNTRLQQGLVDTTNLITGQSKSHSSKIKDMGDRFDKRFNDLSSVLANSIDEIKKLNTAETMLTSKAQLLEDKLSSISSSTEYLKHINYNIAQFKPATMSSISGTNKQASKGVDGDVNSYFQTDTTPGKKHWSVDLQHNFVVARVELVNTLTSGRKFVNAVISAGLSLTDLKVIGQYKGPGSDHHQVITFKLDPPTSIRYVKVEITSNDVLHLAEIRVFGK